MFYSISDKKNPMQYDVGMEITAPADKSISPKLWIVVGLIVVPLVFIFGIGVLWFLNNQATVIEFSNIPKTKTETVAIGRNLVHGELSGSIVSDTSFAGRTVALCTTEKARVLRVRGKIMLECPNKGVKTAPIKEDNSFSIRLLPDTYIVTVSLESSEKSSQIPTQIDIYSDTKTVLPLVIDKK